MEAEQNPEVPEAVAETQVEEVESPAPEEPKSEEVSEAPSPQNPPEPEEAPAEASKEETESTEKTPEVEKTPEKTEPPAEVPKEDEADKKASEEPAAVEEQPKAVEPEKKPETQPEPTAQSEKVEEPAKVDPAESEEKEKPAEAAEEEQKEVSAAAVVSAEPPKASPTKAAPAKEPAFPQFFGWFLSSEVQERIKCSTMEFLKTLDTLEAFKKYISEFTGEAEKEVDLEQYFQTKLPLHCTTMFCDYGKVEGSQDYAALQDVKESLNSTSDLSVIGLIVTPRTFGARVALATKQLRLWPADADKLGVPEADLPGVEALPAGSRAHVTLGCAQDVEPVQTGLDLLDILVAKQGDKEAVAVEELEMGTLSYLGQGRWYLTLREAVTCEATFLSFSEDERLAEPSKKQGGEKKKKPKCSIL